MVSLIDIGPLKGSVMLRGQEIAVSGLPVLVIFEVLKDNEALKKMFMERSFKADDVMTLVNTSPLILAQFIAAGVGKVGDEDTIEFALNLPAGEQAILLEKVLSMSFPSGLSSFIDCLTGLMQDGQAGKSGKEVATN